MKGRHGRVRRDAYESRGEDLSDVNETELAKENEDGATNVDEQQSDRDELRSMAQENKANEIKEREPKQTPKQTPKHDAELPIVVVNEETKIVFFQENELEKTQSKLEATEKQEPLKKTPSSTAKEKGKSARGGGSALYATVILLCLLASLCILLFVVTDRAGLAWQQSSDTSDTDTLTMQEASNGETEGAVVSASDLYSVAGRSAVTVIVDMDGELSYASGTAVLEGG